MKVFEISVMDEPVRVGDDRPVEFKKVVTDEDSQQRRILHVLTKIQEVQRDHYRFGPYVVVIPDGWRYYLRMPYNEYVFGYKTLLQRIKEIEGVKEVAVSMSVTEPMICVVPESL